MTNWSGFLQKTSMTSISDCSFVCIPESVWENWQGLRWGDIDFSQRKIRIQRTVIRIKNLDQIADLVTGKSPKPACTSEHQKQSTPTGRFHYQTNCFFMPGGSAKRTHIIFSLAPANSMEPRVIQRRYANLLKKMWDSTDQNPCFAPSVFLPLGGARI